MTDRDWRADALCAQVDPDMFFLEQGHSPRKAVALCRSCDVQAQCLQYALEHEPEWGIFGGTTPGQRRRMKRDAA